MNYCSSQLCSFNLRKFKSFVIYASMKNNTKDVCNVGILSYNYQLLITIFSLKRIKSLSYDVMVNFFLRNIMCSCITANNKRIKFEVDNKIVLIKTHVLCTDKPLREKKLHVNIYQVVGLWMLRIIHLKHVLRVAAQVPTKICY